ncbi:hypothetical protein M119_0689 [Bacteroides fragilis str. 3783N1-6]|uniref:Uncharacterized protein n=1 Tax=Bacteroides fragilis str. 3783N1-6 TaxID=1339310 RepID=A0AB73APP1_BACFG|nr:hypothetical protein M121_0606 [Bacteroides fragilis str. 3783N2-1]EXY57301.1 hypothetical protein M122_0608 [Bacteroides fragilis str. 3976T7]EXZ69318.1 hypothetical protein M120_0896 [Bacteroides fragilis str. 3783N1-8]EYB11155.1 hypothetical protein M119_0689 [Bacteroides fragilis str. 3783N1-6]EXZ69623.1 hypothetical protein M120_0684 [Bacteroides fragilis str. 3783N1-8]
MIFIRFAGKITIRLFQKLTLEKTSISKGFYFIDNNRL